MTQKLSVSVVAFCILLFTLAGPAKADPMATIESLQAEIKVLQEQIDSLKSEIKSSQPRLFPLPWPHRPRPLPHQIPGRQCSLTLP